MERYLKFYFLLLAALIGAHYVYWVGYWEPSLFFWDENYHLASAAKYLNKVFFMEPHPPLGKLLLALSEKIVGVNNGITYNFERFDIIPHDLLDHAFSFAGYRFLPSLFAVVNVLLFCGISFWITRSYLIAAILTTLPLMDTALILHSRGAMLDSFLIFGLLVAIIAFLHLLKTPADRRRKIVALSFLMTFGISFAYMTKIFGFALCMLWVFAYIIRADIRKLLRRVFAWNFLFSVVFACALWQVHFSLGQRIVPSLGIGGTYYASSQYERWLLGLEKDSWTHFPQKLYEHLRYMFVFETNVEALNWYDPNATGSYALLWPFGSKPISYRWQKEKDRLHRYLYLVPNPWAWATGLLALCLGFIFCVRRGWRTLALSPEIASLGALYVCFLLPTIFIRRVLYLYHYLPMLIITWLLLAYVIVALLKKYHLHRRKIILGLCFLPLLLFQGFHSYKNFVYFKPLSCNEIRGKYYPPFWGMRFVSCDDEEKAEFAIPKEEAFNLKKPRYR